MAAYGILASSTHFQLRGLKEGGNVSEPVVERRRWPRISATSLGMSAVLINGPDAGLMNLSRGGALLEVAGRLSLGAAVRLRLVKAGLELPVINGKVSWQKVASIANGQIHYRVAVVFEQPLAESALGDGVEPAEATADAPAAADAPEAAAGAPEASADAPEPEPDRATAVVQFPSAAPPPKALPAAPAAAADPEADILRRKLAAAKSDLTCQAAVLESLAAKLKDSEQQRTALIRQLADAIQRGDSLQAAWDVREQEHAQAMREQQDNHESVVAELVKGTNDQQAEYETLLEKLQQPDPKRRELEERVEAAEALCAAQQDRYHALRRETEKLMRMIDAAADIRLEVSETKAS